MKYKCLPWIVFYVPKVWLGSGKSKMQLFFAPGPLELVTIDTFEPLPQSANGSQNAVAIIIWYYKLTCEMLTTKASVL